MKQYNHKGDKRGFSEYGEGGSEALKQMANFILYETSLNNTSVSESLQLDKDRAIQNLHSNIKCYTVTISNVEIVGTKVSRLQKYEDTTSKYVCSG